eukprot:Pompholyxophrys_punicea_v1_NODE_1155_length_904_cov_16.810365.p1 type:complete len:174 gc:universal NODE_1155_length_904_cov_16.810365:876-355(-)
MTNLQSSMFTRGTFSIIFITNHNPRQSGFLIATCHSGYSIESICGTVKNRIGKIILRVQCTNQHIVGYVVQMTTIFQPRTSHTDVVGGTFSFHFNEDWKLLKILSIPSLEGSQKLKPITGWRYFNFYIRCFRRRSLISVNTSIITTFWQFITVWRRKFESTICASERICFGIK